MWPSALENLKHHLRVYRKITSMQMQVNTQYRWSFFLELIVELGYVLIYLLFYKIVYGQVQTVGGWSYYQMLLLSGLAIMSTELSYALFLVYNVWRLPAKIKDGDVDFVLLKPVSSLFILTGSVIYHTALIGALSGLGLFIVAFIHLGLKISLATLLSFIIIYLSGLCIIYCLFVMFSSLSFVFLNSESLPNLVDNLVNSNLGRPQQMYFGLLKWTFFLIIPIVYAASIPATVLIHGLKAKYLLTPIVIASIFLWLTVKLWRKMLLKYSSASS